MEQIAMGIALASAVLGVGLFYAWWKYIRHMKRIRSAVGIVLRDYPQYVKTVAELDQYAHALLGELTQQQITFTVVRGQKGVVIA